MSWDRELLPLSFASPRAADFAATAAAAAAAAPVVGSWRSTPSLPWHFISSPLPERAFQVFISARGKVTGEKKALFKGRKGALSLGSPAPWRARPQSAIACPQSTRHPRDLGVHTHEFVAAVEGRGSPVRRPTAAERAKASTASSRATAASSSSSHRRKGEKGLQKQKWRRQHGHCRRRRRLARGTAVLRSVPSVGGGRERGGGRRRRRRRRLSLSLLGS